MPSHFPDKLEKLPCGSIIQHGHHNNRIYLMKMARKGISTLASELIAMATQHTYSKIFVKVPQQQAAHFFKAGYSEEASIPGFYNGSAGCLFMGYYLNDRRSSETDPEALDAIRELALEKAGTQIKSFDVDRLEQWQCKESDIEEMAALYKAVFRTYPFPIDDASYLLDSMRNQVHYFGIKRNRQLIALSSAEMDISARNVEMTDFAILDSWRGNNLSIQLLVKMETEMQQKGIKTAYTIARAASPGINITFSKLGYTYGGRLKNNTNISGKIESMNIWYKTL